jgi:putative effector of murein hydrolase
MLVCKYFVTKLVVALAFPYFKKWGVCLHQVWQVRGNLAINASLSIVRKMQLKYKQEYKMIKHTHTHTHTYIERERLN